MLVVLMVAGCWFFAKRYLDEPLAIAFVCLVGALNSRTALQAAVGHSWHLYYAGMPWVWGAFDLLPGAGPERGRAGACVCGGWRWRRRCSR